MESIKELVNIRKDVTFFKLLSLVALVFTLIIATIYSVISFKMYQNYQQAIYIIDNEGKAFQAELGGNIETRTEPEVYDHVENFHRLFFEIDQYNYTTRIDRALNLIGESGKELYLKLKSNGWFSGIINNNLKQRVLIDDLKIDFTSHPYKGSIDFRVVFEPYDLNRDKRKAVEYRIVVKDFDIYIVSRNRKNAHGLLIENYAPEWKN